MAASNSSPWGPMPGGKPSVVQGGPSHRAPPAVITIDDERRRFENAESARRAQDRFLNSLSRPNITPPPAHGMRPRMPMATSPGLKKPEVGHPPAGGHHPGPPPPLAPIPGGYKPPGGGAPPAAAGVPFKPYDFPRRDQVSPRGGGAYPNYPTAYSAPPISRPQVSSPQVVNVYSKPNPPSRPESLPSSSTSGPPPAHSALPASSHKIPQYLPPPLPAPVQASTPSVRQPLPAPPPIAHQPMAASNNEDQPLDLGFAPKRKFEENENSDYQNHKQIKTEAPAVKMDTTENGLLMRVSEPSALQTTETASSIQTIPNTMHTGANVKTEPAQPPPAEGGEVYVHKLKKAWIKSYNVDQDSAPSTPTNRATPSPALSNASSKPGGTSSKKVNGHSKDESESSDSSMKTKSVKSGKRTSASGSGASTARSTPRLKKNSESDSDSKDSDATVSSRRSGKGRRGRKPKKAQKAEKVKKEEEPEEDNHSIKKEKENPFNNPPISVLKKTGDSFLQDADCFKVAPKLTKCRECKWSQHNKNAGSSTSIFCR